MDYNPYKIGYIPEFSVLLPIYFENFFNFRKPVGTTGSRQLGQSAFKTNSFFEIEVVDKYLPSVMDYNVLYNGLSRSCSPRFAYSYNELYNCFLFGVEAYKYMAFSNIVSFDEAVNDFDLTKSPGWPGYFKYRTKQYQLDAERQLLQDLIGEMLNGDCKLVFPITCTLKDELLPASKVNTDYSKQKTRVFYNVPFILNILGAILFKEQNENLRKAMLKHPSTIGVNYPGPGFLKIFIDLYNFDPKYCFDDDATGFDIMCNVGLCAVVREIRKQFLPKQYHKAVDFYYSAIYNGYVSVCGVVCNMPGNKSGHYNTADDNSIIKSFYYLLPYLYYTKRSPITFQMDVKCFCNGDDGIVSIKDAIINPVQIQDYLAERFHYIELTSKDFKTVFDCFYLSATVIPFSYAGVNTIIAKPNLNKVLSCMNYVKSRDFVKCFSRWYALNGQMFCDLSLFRKVRKIIDNTLVEYKEQMTVAEYQQILTFRLSEHLLFNILTGFESSKDLDNITL